MKKYTRKGNLGYSPFIEYFFMKKFCFGKHKEFLSYPFLFAEILFFKLFNMKKIIITLFLVLSLFIYKPLSAYTNEEYLNEMTGYRDFYLKEIEETKTKYKKYLNDINSYISSYNNSIDLLKSQSNNSTCEWYARAQSYGSEQVYNDLVSKCSNNSQNNTSLINDYNSKILKLELEYNEIKEERDTTIYNYQLKVDEINDIINQSSNSLETITTNDTITNSCGINSYSNWDWKCSCEEWYERSDKNDLTNLNCSKIEEWDLVCKKSFGSNSYYIWTKTDDWKYNCNCSTWYVWNSNGNKCVEEKTADELYKLGLKYIEEWDWINGIYYMNEAKKTAESGNNINLINEINDMYKFLSVDDINIANYLAVQWIIVNHSSSPLLYNLGRNVLRQEIASISLKLWWIEKKNKCDNLFSDISSIKPNDWVCLNIEPLLERWLISNNKKFRPEENITKAEALWMLIKVKWLDYKLVTNSSKTWQQQIAEYAVREWLVEDFNDYDTYATRKWIFKVVDNIITKDIIDSLEWLE